MAPVAARLYMSIHPGARRSCINTMVPYHLPIPDSSQPGKARGAISTLVQAEKMMQIALILPCSAFVGWLPGLWLDKHFNQKWISLVGIVFGGVSGLIYVVRLALAADKDPAMQDTNSGESGSGSAGSEP